jgi:hypothetical protein
MSSSNKNEPFDLSAQEKGISKLYQNYKRQHGEEPSLNIDAEIMAMAQQQLSENSNSMDHQHKLKQAENGVNHTQPDKRKIWRGPFSLVASVCVLTILLITQRDYLIHPNQIDATDVSTLDVPVSKVPKISSVESFAEEKDEERSSRARQVTVSAQRDEVVSDQKYAALAKKSMSIIPTPKEHKEQLLERTLFVDNAPKISTISLEDIYKLAEVLKLEMTSKDKSKLELNSKITKLQQDLFEHMSTYQEGHGEITLTEDFLNVLTDKQIKQLQSMAIETVPKN